MSSKHSLLFRWECKFGYTGQIGYNKIIFCHFSNDNNKSHFMQWFTDDSYWKYQIKLKVPAKKLQQKEDQSNCHCCPVWLRCFSSIAPPPPPLAPPNSSSMERGKNENTTECYKTVGSTKGFLICAFLRQKSPVSGVCTVLNICTVTEPMLSY